MTVEQQIAALFDLAQENSRGIKDLLNTSREHTKQLELDGQHIKQLAMIVQDQNNEIDKMASEIRKLTNGITALVEVSAGHEARLNRLEEGGQA